MYVETESGEHVTTLSSGSMGAAGLSSLQAIRSAEHRLTPGRYRLHIVAEDIGVDERLDFTVLA